MASVVTNMQLLLGYHQLCSSCQLNVASSFPSIWIIIVVLLHICYYQPISKCNNQLFSANNLQRNPAVHMSITKQQTDKV